MNKKILILGIAFSALMFTSCVKDLNVIPKDPNTILAGNLGDSAVYMTESLGKIYASFIISGQGSSGGDDIAASDGNFFTTTRALWNCQEITTDEAICAWGDVGIADLNTQTWSPQNPFLTALYQRLSLSVTYANEFIRNTNGKTDPIIVNYNAQARFLRALAYAWDMDLFGNPPFVTDLDGVGKFFPKQLDPDPKIGRAKLFNYIVSELHAIETKLPAPDKLSSQANQAACWMLLARVYLNAKVGIVPVDHHCVADKAYAVIGEPGELGRKPVQGEAITGHLVGGEVLVIGGVALEHDARYIDAVAVPFLDDKDVGLNTPFGLARVPELVADPRDQTIGLRRFDQAAIGTQTVPGDHRRRPGTAKAGEKLSARVQYLEAPIG